MKMPNTKIGVCSIKYGFGKSVKPSLRLCFQISFVGAVSDKLPKTPPTATSEMCLHVLITLMVLAIIDPPYKLGLVFCIVMEQSGGFGPLSPLLP